MEENSSNTFTLTPMSQDIALKPGSTYTGSITIINPASSKSDFNYKVSVTPFNVVGDEYAVDLATEYNRSMITKWIKVSEPTGTLKPNESRQIEYTIKVPDDAPAGGQYATLTVSQGEEQAKDGGLSVNSVLEMASVIYAAVDGETVHQGQILENSIPGFVVGPPVKLTAVLENSGNVHEFATYTITVKDLFTGQVILPTDENDGQYSEVIMPETTFHSEREISNLPTIGIVNVTQTIKYNGQTSTQESNIIICPIWFIVLVLLTIAALITTIVLIVKKHRKHKKSLGNI